MSVITADFYPPRRFLSFNLLILNRRSKMPFWRTQVKPRQTLVNSASHMKGKSPNITQANARECIASSFQGFKTNTFITRESLLCFPFLKVQLCYRKMHKLVACIFGLRMSAVTTTLDSRGRKDHAKVTGVIIVPI